MLIASTVNAPVLGLRREFERLFQEQSGTRRNGESQWAPPVDIRETENELTIAVELPGIKPEGVEVTAHDGVLMIRGERTEEGKAGEDARYHLVERNMGPFMRHFHLPAGVDTDKIDADFEYGVLHVRIKKAALPQPKKIAIRVGTSARSPVRQPVIRRESRLAGMKKPAGALLTK